MIIQWKYWKNQIRGDKVWKKWFTQFKKWQVY